MTYPLQNLSNEAIDNAMLSLPVRIIRIKSVCEQTGMSKSHIYHLAAQGLFPKSVSLVPGGASKGWVEAEVQAWIRSRIALRNEEV